MGELIATLARGAILFQDALRGPVEQKQWWD
jgi:hypothetical protein